VNTPSRSVWFLAALLAACHVHPKPAPGGGDAGNTSGDAAVLDGGGDPCASGDCPNVVDAVVLGMLAQNGLSVVPEDDGVLCRRMAIDLTGIVPTADELATQCAGHTPAEMATYFMNKPGGPNVPTQMLDSYGKTVANDHPTTPYAFVNRRAWADQFQYNTTSTNGNDTAYYAFGRDLDRLVNDTYLGKISYDTFAKRALGHPSFVRRFGIFDTNSDLIQIASQAFRMFMGREALPSEAADFGNLWRPWVKFAMDEPTSEAKYPDCPGNGIPGNKQCYHTDLGLNGANCADAALVDCQSSVLGFAQAVPTNPGVVGWADWTAAEHTVAEVPGGIIAARPEFVDAAVDRSLQRYLGWWKNGFFKPTFDIPAVRDALGKQFVHNGYDVRKLDFEIVTSVLYTQASTLRPMEGAADPIWAFGPTKILPAEVWLDSISQALGKQLGGCDFVYSVSASFTLPSMMVFPIQAGIDPGSPAYVGYYGNAARQLGGCPAAGSHSSPTGLVSAIVRRSVLAGLCPGAIKPAADNTTLFTTVFPGIGRPPSAAEQADALTLMNACASPDNCTPQGMADALCTSLFASSLFNYY
jgi:hypothetical protein